MFDFLITLPIAAFGFFFLPGDPYKPRKSLLLSEEDYAFARKRVAISESVENVNKFDFSIVKGILTSLAVLSILHRICDESIDRGRHK